MTFPDNGYPVRTPGHRIQRRLYKEDTVTDPSYRTRVVFRKWYRKKDGNGVIALFPDEHEHRPGTVLSYEHHGQHGAADYTSVIARTKPATAEEYAALKKELEGYPFHYDLVVRRKA